MRACAAGGIELVYELQDARNLNWSETMSKLPHMPGAVAKTPCPATISSGVYQTMCCFGRQMDVHLAKVASVALVVMNTAPYALVLP